MQAMRMINAVDSHTMGEPTRIITGGVPVIQGNTMMEKKEYLESNLDYLRTAIMLEPREGSKLWRYRFDHEVELLNTQKLARELYSGKIFKYKRFSELTDDEKSNSTTMPEIWNGNEIMREPIEGRKCWKFLIDKEVELLN